MLIRPVTLFDHDAVLRLAKAAGFGMTSLPADADVLGEKVERAVASFNGTCTSKGSEVFLFVMEDPETGEVVGTTGIKPHIGLSQPFYSYKLTTITQVCKDPEIFSKHEMLNVTNDLTGCSEIGSLFLLPDYRRDKLGRLLSLFRFLFIANFPDHFAPRIIAEMRGVNDRHGASPFYNSLAKHFFEMEFFQADYLNATRGNDFINALMPRYPIYVSLLPKEAQEVIGQAHPNSEPARAMLEREGFRWNGYLDIFDGGPTLETDASNIKTVKESHIATISQIAPNVSGHKHLISTISFAGTRACADNLQPLPDGTVALPPHTAELLQVGIGDMVRFVAQKTR